MNSETAILVALALAVLIIASLFGLSNGAFSYVEDVVKGDNGNDGLFNRAKDTPEGSLGNHRTVSNTGIGEVFRWLT